MKRLILVYNPRSSGFGRVRSEVIDKSRELRGWMVGKYEVLDTDVDDNAARLARMLNDGDVVVSAGGDGTATIALNGVMLTKAKDVKLGMLAYGNFNDVARMFGMMDFSEVMKTVNGEGGGEVVDVWGLECLVNGEHWRWGMGYFTVGLLAEAAALFDDKIVRGKLRKGRRGLIGQLVRAVGWYGKNRRKRFLPEEFLYNGDVVKNITDMVMMNGERMAKVLRGKNMILEREKFMAGAAGNGDWRRMIWFGVRSVLRRVPVTDTDRAVMKFLRGASVMIQAEGEYKRLSGVRTIEVRKAKRSIGVVMKG